MFLYDCKISTWEQKMLEMKRAAFCKYRISDIDHFDIHQSSALEK